MNAKKLSKNQKRYCVPDLIAPHSLPVLSPVTFRMILTRQTFESPCSRQQQRYKPKNMGTDAINSQWWKISHSSWSLIENTEQCKVPQSFVGIKQFICCLNYLVEKKLNVSSNVQLKTITVLLKWNQELREPLSQSQITGNCVLRLELYLRSIRSVWRHYLLLEDLSQSAKLQRGRTTHYGEVSTPVFAGHGLSCYLIAFCLFHPNHVGWPVCVMASVLLHGLPLLPPWQGAV